MFPGPAFDRKRNRQISREKQERLSRPAAEDKATSRQTPSRPVDRDAAVGKKRGSGGEARGVGGEVERRAGDLLGFGNTLQRMQTFHESAGLGGLEGCRRGVGAAG